MKKENKKDVKKGVLTGAGSVAGAMVAGVVENTLNVTGTEITELPEVDVLKTDPESFSEVIDDEQQTISAETESIMAMVEDTETIAHQPERKPAVNHTESLAVESNSQENVDIIVDIEPNIEEALISEEEPEPVAEETSDVDDDIMVVSVESEESADIDTDNYDDTIEISEIHAESMEDEDGPNYMDIKDNELGVGSNIMSSTDMPDYVNDANIESFTDNV